MVRRPTRRHQADNRIHDRLRIDHMRHRAFARLRQLHTPHSRRSHQRIAQRRARIDERGAGQVKPHQLHHHLVGIGRAIEGARARRVIARRLRFQQLLARNLPKRELLAHAGLLLVADPRRHRPRWREDHRQMPERQRPDHQPRHDLVARAQHQRRIERIMRQRHGRAQRNHIAREQRQLHPRPPLRDTIAHRRRAPGHLRRRAYFPRRILDDVRIVLERLMRAQHVVIAGHDADVRRAPPDGQLVAQRHRRESMRQVPARKMLPPRPRILRRLHARQIVGAAVPAALLDARRNLGDFRMKLRHAGTSALSGHIDPQSPIRTTRSRNFHR